MRSIGIVGWSGSGKTTLITALLPILRARELSVSTIKNVHSGFDLDRPGKDSFRHREAGAHEVMVVGANRWALLHEVVGREPSLNDLLLRLSEVDLVLVEGFKTYPFSKIEVHRPSLGKPPIWPEDKEILAVATDEPLKDCDRVLLPLNRPDRIANWVLRLVGWERGRIARS